MTVFRYAATDLITGKILSDSIPLDVQNFSANLNGGGTLTGSLTLSEVYAVNRPFVAALECRRAVLWALAGSYPCWCGVCWDWPETLPARSSGILPVSAQTIESVLSKRKITADLAYAGVDLFAVFADLVQYGVTKDSPYITATSPESGPVSPLVASAARVAGLILPSGAAAVSGIPWTATYAATDGSFVLDALNALVTASGMEYAFVPGLDPSGNLCVFLRLGYTALGRAPEEAGYSLTYPGNVSDYAYQRTGSGGANYIRASASPNGSLAQYDSAWPHGADLDDLGQGYPLMEDAVTYPGSAITEQSQIDGYADGVMAQRTQAMTMPVIEIAGGNRPGVLDLVLGDTIPFAATSNLHPPGAGGTPGLQQLVRVAGWTAYPPSAASRQPETLQIATSGVLAIPGT
jgi:hypothetical protein